MDSQQIRNLQEAYLEVVMNEEKVKYPYGKVANQNKKLERKASSEPDPKNQDAKYIQADRHHGIHKRVGGLPYHQLGNPENRLQPDEKLPKKKTPNKFGNRLTRSDGQGIRDSYEYDLYDIILSHLLDEGYADTQEQAEVIMVNMSEDWRESICEGYKERPVSRMNKQARRIAFSHGTDVNSDEGSSGNVPHSNAAGALAKMARFGGKEVKSHIKKGYEQGSRYDPYYQELNSRNPSRNKED